MLLFRTSTVFMFILWYLSWAIPESVHNDTTYISFRFVCWILFFTLNFIFFTIFLSYMHGKRMVHSFHFVFFPLRILSSVIFMASAWCIWTWNPKTFWRPRRASSNCRTLAWRCPWWAPIVRRDAACWNLKVTCHFQSNGLHLAKYILLLSQIYLPVSLIRLVVFVMHSMFSSLHTAVWFFVLFFCL